MTEAYEDGLVRVRAQVMTRDEGTGGWVALGGGGLANVMVGKRRPDSYTSGGDSSTEDSLPRQHNSTPNYEYFIYGIRISDNTEVLSCTIKKDFQYNKVMPTFHHWYTDEKRFGLTFQTAADARAFDRGVRCAIEELLDGLGGAWPSLHAYKKHNPAPQYEDEENNIFECLNLPTDSRSSSSNSTASRARRADPQTPILSAINLPHTHWDRDTSLKQHKTSGEEDKPGAEDANPEHSPEWPYVQLSAVHDYTYPQVGTGTGVVSSEHPSPDVKPSSRKGDDESLKKQNSGSVCSCGPPALPDKKSSKPNERFQARIRCRHCHEWYLESANRAGSCEYAPDCCRECVNTVSCIKCAQCMFYHCLSDAEGDFAARPFVCAPPDHACAIRWTGLALLSLLVPCLCCYLPLRCVHRAATRAHLAGGHHAPAT